MIKFVVQFLILFLFWWDNKRAKGGWSTPSGFLIGIYVICSLLGVFDLWVESNLFTQPYSSSYWIPMLQFVSFILLFLLPFRQFNESNIKQIVLPSREFLNIFSNIIIVLSFLSIAFYGTSVVNIFSMSDLGYARDTMGEENLYFEAGLLATIGSVAASNYVFAIALFFIYKIIGNSKTRCALLLISSFSEPVQVLAFVGRDGIVFWIFTFVMCFLFFRPYLPVETRKRTVRLVLKAGLVMFIPFFLISTARFSKSDIGTVGSVISYLGHAFIQGPLFFGIENKPNSYGAGFPLFYELTGYTRPHTDSLITIGDWISWRFSTFVVSLYQNISLVGLIIVCFSMYVVFMSTIGRVKSKINLGHFTLYLLYFQIISQGVFYFKQYTRGGNLFIITTILLSIVFANVVKNSKKPIVLKKGMA